MSQADLRARVEAAASAALAKRKFVTPVDVCVGIGWLRDSNVDDWRRGRVDDLEYFLPVHDERLIDLIMYLHEWAQAHGLTRVDTDYVSATRDRHRLRFFTNGEPIEEAAWRSQWISADIPAERRERIVERQAAPPDLVVVQPVKDWACAECDGTGDLLIMDDQGPLCLTCADLDHLVFLPAGDSALTRRAKKASTLAAAVVRFNCRPVSSRRSPGCFPAARPGAPWPSPGTPPCGAAAGWAARLRAVPWTRRPSRWPWWRRSGTRTRSTTRC